MFLEPLMQARLLWYVYNLMLVLSFGSVQQISVTTWNPNLRKEVGFPNLIENEVGIFGGCVHFSG